MKRFLDDRTRWSKLVEVIQSNMPENMWLVTLEYESDNMLNGGGEAQNSEQHEGGGEEGVVTSSANPDKRQNISHISRSTTINRVHMVGYTCDGGISIASEFLRRMRDYSQQENSLISGISPTGNNESSSAWNLYYFEYKLTLREPIKK